MYGGASSLGTTLYSCYAHNSEDEQLLARRDEALKNLPVFYSSKISFLCDFESLVAANR